MLRTVGSAPRRRFGRRSREAEPDPEPTAVAITRATVIDAVPEPTRNGASRWVASSGEQHLTEGLRVLNRALQAHRIASADPYVRPLRREDALVARLGFGTGEEVADGDWSQAREILPSAPRQRRARVLEPQSRLAALLGAKIPALACEELALRARLDLDQGELRTGALSLDLALQIALAELAADPAASLIGGRLEELRTHRKTVTPLAELARSGALPVGAAAELAEALQRLEAALRARAASSSASGTATS